MNDPTGLRRRRRQGRQPAPVGGAAQRQHVARADPHVPRGLPGCGLPRGGRLRARRGCAGGATRYDRTALVVTLAFASLCAPVQVIVGDWAAREVAERQPVKLAAIEGLQRTPGGRAVHVRRLLRRGRAASALAGSRSRSCSRCSPPRSERDGDRARIGAAGGPPAGEHRALRVPDDGRRSARASRCSARCSSSTWCASGGCRASRWFYRAVMAAGPLSFVALIAGWITTEVGRQPWIVYEVMRTEQAVTRRTAWRSATRADRRLLWRSAVARRLAAAAAGAASLRRSAVR